MRLQKKLYSLLCIMVMILVVVACSGNNKSDEKNDTAAPATTENEGTKPADTTPIKEEPAEIKLFISDHNLALPKADDIRIKHMEEKANVKLNIEFLPHSDYSNQFKLKFASGDFPDFYQNWSAPSSDLIEGGKILVLNDLIDEYGPNLKKFIPQETWDSVTFKGEILAIPQPSDTISGQVLYIRKDWLDKLGLEIPTTSNELLDVMRAFRDSDMNGNGKADEIAFTMRENLAWADPLFGMWGVGPAWLERYYNDELILTNIHPNMLKALDFLHTMYDEKLLDSEFLSNSRSIQEQKIKAGLVGMWSHTPQLSTTWQKDLVESLPEEEPNVIAIPTPRGEGYDGPVGNKMSPLGKTFTIFKDAKNPEAIIRLLDWLISEEGQLFTELGLEGDTFFRATTDGKITFDQNKAKDILWLSTLFKLHGYSPEATKVKLGDDDAFARQNLAFDIANNEGIPNEAIGMPPIDNQYNMITMFLEIAAKVIIGESSLTDFESFMQEWRNQGGSELVKQRTEWYNENRK